MHSTHPRAPSPAQTHAKLLLCQRVTPSHTKSCQDEQSTHPFSGSIQKISPLVAHTTLRHVRGDSNEQGPATGEIKTLGGGRYNKYRLLATVADRISGRNPLCWKLTALPPLRETLLGKFESLVRRQEPHRVANRPLAWAGIVAQRPTRSTEKGGCRVQESSRERAPLSCCNKSEQSSHSPLSVSSCCSVIVESASPVPISRRRRPTEEHVQCQNRSEVDERQSPSECSRETAQQSKGEGGEGVGRTERKRGREPGVY